MPSPARVPLFDFDGTLVDSDAALTAPWHALGVDPAVVPLGMPLGEA
jgi:beta-phosphoglucomutase-like phosphatase (HAD superfamily)